MLGAVVLAAASPARANPPAPYNLIYGVVRDQYGTPLTSAAATIVLETPAGTVIAAPVLPGYAPGVNYKLKVPMDSGQSPGLYQPTAQLAAAPFKLFVVINNATNLPIEMTGSFATLGQPGGSVRMDLTLGVDSNGDGIPDSWEEAFLAALGLNVPLASIHANSVLTSDGLTLRQQYVFGTYPFNPSQPCRVTLAGFQGSSPTLQFPTMTGRYYSVLISSDTVHWSTASFYLPTDDPSGPARTSYYSPGIGTAEVQVLPASTPAPQQFYRILVQ